MGGGICILSICYAISYILLALSDKEKINGNLQIGSAVLVVLIFSIVKEISDSKIGEKFLNKWASSIAQYSFGIYLMHIYVIRDFVWRIFENYRI